MKKTPLVLVGVLAGILSCFGQEKLDRPYLGRTPPGETREVFLPGLIERIALSRDGRELYFNGKDGGLQVRRLVDGNWTEPAVLVADGGAAALSGDDQSLYFQNSKFEILHAERTSTGWSTPAVTVSGAGKLHYFQRTDDGTCFASVVPGAGIQGQIARLRPEGSAIVAEPLPAPINSADNGTDFCMARDGSFIIFVIHPGGANGDLNISFRRADGNWTDPKNLGPGVNGSATWEWGPYLSPDGRFLFFTAGSSPADVAIWWVRVDQLIERLREASLAPDARTSDADRPAGAEHGSGDPCHTGKEAHAAGR